MLGVMNIDARSRTVWSRDAFAALFLRHPEVPRRAAACLQTERGAGEPGSPSPSPCPWLSVAAAPPGWGPDFSAREHNVPGDPHIHIREAPGGTTGRAA